MFHYFKWQIHNYWNYKILKNNFLGIQITYFWTQLEWDFFLHPILDTNNNTLYYLWFDNIQQLDIFHKLVKISGIGWKTACYISTSYSLDELNQAISSWDLKFFKQIPWIWPKTAKKIIIEIKDKLSLEDFEKEEQEDKQKESIIRWIVWLGYPKEKVKKILKDYNWDLKDVQSVIKDIIKKL